ncbi:NlpC/P60 family protein [Aerococcus agrisoli]|uniref:NlpC/P60 family protein n=1 Tax=Aerococcus agrisoli TaxID=2487350 RepID=A0A3N4GNT5_9LACT|nr:C40 family peptidase [Aerococcus agrisoli]RPA60781.1 NlpC/P60 family protein [Aerococcus agrisoli]
MKYVKLKLLSIFFISISGFFVNAQLVYGQTRDQANTNTTELLVSPEISDIYLNDQERQAIIQEGIALLGQPYVWGGNTIGGFDCSGFIEYIFKKEGKYMPRTTQQQQYFGDKIPVNQALPGDLYFFEDNGDVYHVALALGEGAYIHSPSPGHNVSYGHTSRFQAQFALRVL